MDDGFLDWLYGVIMRPAGALRAVAGARPVGWAILVGGTSWTLTTIGWLLGIDLGVFERLGFEGAAVGLALTRLLPLAVVAAACAGLAVLGLMHLFARLLGGRGAFSSLFCAVGFASFPAILVLPLAALERVGHPGIAAATSLARLGLAAWLMALDVIAVREAHDMPTGAAAIAFVLSVFSPLVLLSGLLFLAATLAAGLGAAFMDVASWP